MHYEDRRLVYGRSVYVHLSTGQWQENNLTAYNAFFFLFFFLFLEGSCCGNWAWLEDASQRKQLRAITPLDLPT
jgi:hypothetical protein